MATVVREIERKYDPAAGATAALDAVKAMTGTAGVPFRSKASSCWTPLTMTPRICG